MVPIPATYWSLKRWYPRIADRARALGISRQTLTTWERDPDAARIRASTAKVIDRVSSVTADVEDLVGAATGAAPWMMSPQPLAGGAVPAALARENKLGVLRRLMFDSPADETPRRVEAGVSRSAFDPPVVAVRERPRSRGEAIVLARIGEDPDLIGPIAD